MPQNSGDLLGRKRKVKPLEIYKTVKELETHDIYKLYESRGIRIVHNPELFTHTSADARIITDIFGNTTVFLRMRTGEMPWFEEFVLWHEFGHFKTGGLAFMPQAFNSEAIQKQEELSQNIFAFFGLLYSSRGSQNFEGSSKHLGIPEDVLQTVMDALTSDPEFSEYVARR